MITNAREFGELVARSRKALGITQRQLALAINTGERFIVDLEAGKPTAQLGKALAAAKAAGLRLEDMSGGGPRSEPLGSLIHSESPRVSEALPNLPSSEAGNSGL
jgi:y4mF family transcriptional regulator